MHTARRGVAGSFAWLFAIALAACAEGTVTGSDASRDDVTRSDGATSEASSDAIEYCSPACTTWMVCVEGVCVLACDATSTACNGACVHIDSDAMNCGACGHACTAGMACSGGACGGTCATGEMACPVAGGGATTCVNTTSDARNCGACGHACMTGEICEASACCMRATYEQTTGAVSGNGMVCCNAGDVIVGAPVDCGSGANHSVSANGNCGTASEGAMNGGSACVSITCAMPGCS